ncbi:O-acetylhomoserine (thiol)-lyase [Elusimicrobium posterum]|uniref:O-acetylhomoserine aminocarboxypropyltransferase/cysteine synthase family protein n=1 Tax=Elusimicrobium posterum TaxID=3116653 RepID=UPI003C75740B
MTDKLKFESIAAGAAYKIDETGATNPPLYLSNAYYFKSAEYAKNLFDLKEAGYIYTRLNNPTNNELEDRITQLEGGVGSLVTSCGHSAEFMAICCLCESGDEIISSSALYGGTFNMFSHTLRRLGIKVNFVNVDKPEEFEKAVNEKTKAIFVEAISNPGCEVPDFEEISKIAKKHKLPLIVDNTYLTPYLFNPKQYGADLIIHSTTKYICGHAGVMGGSVTDCGTFDWSSGRFPSFTEADPSYHGVAFHKHFGPAAFIARLRTVTLRDIGGCQSPFNSYLTMQGLQTLHVRMDRHQENTLKIVEFLKNHPKVAFVNYAGDKDNKYFPLTQKYFKKGAGAMLSFEAKGGYEAGKKFIETVKLAIHATNLGDVRTVVTHPASTTHSQLTPEERKKNGVGEGLIRVSIGIENADDIIADFDNALK